ncbi:RNA-binding domain-containing protein [Spirochaeta dissipatitropha]
MTKSDVLFLLESGENKTVEFKDHRVRSESLAREIVSMANTVGGVILLGIQNDGEVSGLTQDKNWEEWVSNISRSSVNPSLTVDFTITEIHGSAVGVLIIPKGKDKPYQTVQDGKFWIRVGSTVRQATKEELSRLFQASGLVHFDISAVNHASVDDLDQNRIARYFSDVYELEYRTTDYDEQIRILKNSSILTDGDTELVPSVGGMLVFAQNPQKYLPHAALTVAVINGVDISDDVIQKKEIDGVLPEQVDNALGFLLLHVPEPLVLDETARRKDTLAISRTVLREVLVNAVCHRDYSMSNQKIQIFLYKDRIEVRNPGKVANSLTLEMIRYGNSAPRNIFLVKLMDNLRYIDGLGRGVPLIIKHMGDRVVFREIGDTFSVTLWYS